MEKKASSENLLLPFFHFDLGQAGQALVFKGKMWLKRKRKDYTIGQSSYYRLILPQRRGKWLMAFRHFLVQVNLKKGY